MSEESRHHRDRRLEEVLGPAEATVLMEHLPPVGWADVATKRDLDALSEHLDHRFHSRIDRLEGRMDSRIEHLDIRLEQIDKRLSDFRAGIYAMLSIMLVFAGTMVAIVKL